MALLTRLDIITALERLGQLAAADGCLLRLVIVGAAAMAACNASFAAGT